MQLVSSPRLSARGPAATRTSAAQGAGSKNIGKMVKNAPTVQSENALKKAKMAKNGHKSAKMAKMAKFV